MLCCRNYQTTLWSDYNLSYSAEAWRLGIVWTEKGFLYSVSYCWKTASWYISSVPLSNEISFSPYYCSWERNIGYTGCFAEHRNQWGLRASEVRTHLHHRWSLKPRKVIVLNPRYLRKFFFWQAEISVLQFSFRERLDKIGIALQINSICTFYGAPSVSGAWGRVVVKVLRY